MADHRPVLFPHRHGPAAGSSKLWISALKGADDGELFLEYSQSESFAFDDGRLKAATFDTSQGFGLRAVAGEATGYAHATESSEDAIARAASTVRAVSHGHSGTVAAAPARSNVKLYTDIDPLQTARLREEGQAAGRDERLCARQGQPGAPGVGVAVGRMAAHRDHARRRRALFRHPPPGAASTSRWWWNRMAARNPAASAAAAAAAMRPISIPITGRRAVDEALRQALVNLTPFPPRPAR